jgi:citrate lyase subunit beta/citryl-CoA lyase
MNTSALLRTMLSVPALNPRFLIRAEQTPADAIVLDLEDSIAAHRKTEARTAAALAIPGFAKRGRLLLCRPNALETGLLEADLDAVVLPGLDGVHLPKTHDARLVERVDHYLTLLERRRGITPGSLRIIAWVESTRGVAAVESICTASARLLGVSMGAEDYATDLRVMRTRAGTEIEFARARVANAALAAGLVPIACPEPDYRDAEHFERECRHARTLGYRGKYCIHPSQVTIGNRVFAPGEAEVGWARRVVEAYEAGEREGLGAVGLDGSMVDRPVYVRALDVLQVREAVSRPPPDLPA